MASVPVVICVRVCLDVRGYIRVSNRIKGEDFKFFPHCDFRSRSKNYFSTELYLYRTEWRKICPTGSPMPCRTGRFISPWVQQGTLKPPFPGEMRSSFTLLLQGKTGSLRPPPRETLPHSTPLRSVRWNSKPSTGSPLHHGGTYWIHWGRRRGETGRRRTSFAWRVFSPPG